MQAIPTGAQAIALGIRYSIVLKRDGSIWATGYNSHGELGDGFRIEENGFMKVNLNPAKAVAAGSSHSMVLKRDGSVWAAGRNDYGQLGDNSTIDKRIFVCVGQIDNSTTTLPKRTGMRMCTDHVCPCVCICVRASAQIYNKPRFSTRLNNDNHHLFKSAKRKNHYAPHITITVVPQATRLDPSTASSIRDIGSTKLISTSMSGTAIANKPSVAITTATFMTNATPTMIVHTPKTSMDIGKAVVIIHYNIYLVYFKD